MDKATLRAHMREQVDSIKPLERALQEELVNAAIMASPEWRDAELVLLYKHKGAEFSINSLGNAAFRDGKMVCFPRVDGEALGVHRVDGWRDLAPGAYGIDEPSENAPVVDPLDVDLVVVPGLAWTEDGHRLGQGGGFYDRLLPFVGGTKFGVGFDLQKVLELPVDEHDVGVDKVWFASDIAET